MPLPTAPVRAIEAVVDFLYPPRCLICPSTLADRTEGVCAPCWSSIAVIGPSHPAWMEAESTLSSDGLVDGLHALFLFEKQGVLQQALHLLKYGGMHSLGVRLGVDLGVSLIASGLVRGVGTVVPVPLHGAKLRERGYNQSDRICDGIRAATGLPVDRRALVRTRHTRSQTTLKVHEREANVRDAFSVARGGGNPVGDATVLLVDDVLTTGATLRSCALALKEAGVASVICATVALAP